MRLCCVFVQERYITISWSLLTSSLYSKVWLFVNSSGINLKHSRCIVFELAAFLLYVCISAVGDSVHRTYFTICPVCEDTSGRAGEGKETQHSFEELGLLDGNNHHGRKTRLKIATASLWHCGRLQFFHRWLFHAHIRTRKVDMEVTFRCKRLITFLVGGGLISTLLLNWIQAASSA